MPHIHALPKSKVTSVLEGNGFSRVRTGKHETYKRRATDGKILTTWVPHHSEISAFVIHHIIRQTGKPRDEFY